MVAGAMIVSGMAILVGYGIYATLDTIAENLAGPVRIAMVLLVVGLLLFIAALIRTRLIAARECDSPREEHKHPEKDESPK